jgi:hypothetical protein
MSPYPTIAKATAAAPLLHKLSSLLDCQQEIDDTVAKELGLHLTAAV